MSQIVHDKQQKFLISFGESEDHSYHMLATNIKQFFVQKSITSEYIQQNFNESGTKIKISIAKIIKIMKEEQPAGCEIKSAGTKLNLSLSYPIKISHKNSNLCDRFRVDFLLQECTSPAEIGELFVRGLLKSLVELKLGNNESQVSLPKTTFEVKFQEDDKSLSRLCELIGGDAGSEGLSSSETLQETGEASDAQNARQMAVKRPAGLINQEIKFENSQDSQELDMPTVKKVEKSPEKVIKPVKKKWNIKF